MKLYELSAARLISLLEAGEIKASEIQESVQKRIDEVEDRVHAYATLDRNTETGSSKSAGGESVLDLKGIPVAVKDNICTKGVPTTCSSRILEGFIPPYDAAVINRLKKANAFLLGKTNMDEFAFGSSCETSCYGPTHNPWDLSRIPGGSSGGSAAAVASGEAILALGSDTGGSIRQPAAMCGVVGLKPTYGRVSRYGLIAFASSLDQIGTITKTVEDSALLMNVIAGGDENDSTCSNEDVPDFTKSLEGGIKDLIIGVPDEYFVEGLDKEVEEAVNEAIKLLSGLGAKVERISLPHTKYAVSTYYLIAPAEASSNLARFDGVQYGLRRDAEGITDMYKVTRSSGFGEEAIRRIILGTYSLSSGYYEDYYLKAQKVRAVIAGEFKEAFKKVDCLITPTSPTTAFKIGERIEDPLKMYLSDVFTIPANLAGLPAMSVPCGFCGNNLPVGMQILAKPFGEKTIFKTAYAYQENSQWHKRKPSL
ncbi:MAG: Asp-tRNA(Asn)/Glu-tRNA(Gln) amidotransferase subunit GatA [Candidatus Omnitrophica bacterium]|nr:Asp-tRNA(Asn)/Glu-tRNA(Gln) amidotransferase subunit GatA [Candidatus Omnitrophota bacterium]